MDVERNEQQQVSAGRRDDDSKPISGSQAPPSYDSFYRRLQSVKDESSGPGDCLKKFITVLCGSVFGTIALGIILAVPISMIAVGAVYLNECPIQRYIPIYLIVGGCFGVVQSLLTMSLRIRNQREGKDDQNSRPNPASGIISCFLFAWFIAGSVWVYSIYSYVETSDHPKVPSHYCHASVYWYAFVLITLGYVFMALSCCCVATCGILAVCLKKE